jgi:hypothetical protein
MKGETFVAFYCLTSKGDAYVVDEIHGGLLVFKGKLQAYWFKIKLGKWHWKVVPANTVHADYYPPEMIPTLYDIVY